MRVELLLLSVLYTIFIWWFTTGLVIVLYGRSRRTVRLFFLGATAALGLAFAGLIFTRDQHGPLASYLAVTCGVIIWAWQIGGYYLGFITGPDHSRRLLEARIGKGQQRGISERFWLALHFSLYHELLAVAVGILIALLTTESASRWALWMYVALWLMHASAKLNVFLGVRNFRIDFLPRQLHILESLLSKRETNPLFPVSILVASSVTLALLYHAISPATSAGDTVGLVLVATMIGLGVLEHLLLVIPIPATLYGWGIRAIDKPGAETSIDSAEPPMRVAAERVRSETTLRERASKGQL